MPDQASTLRTLYDKYTAKVARHEATERRARERKNQAVAARDGIRVTMELEGCWHTVSQREEAASPASASSPGLTPTIKKLLPHLQGHLDVNKIIEAVRGADPDLAPPGKESSVSSALKRLSSGDDAVLELVEEGAGRKPAKYRYIGNDQDPAPLSADSNSSTEGGENDI